MCESDAKFNEEVFEFINSAWREYEEELYYDAISGEVMIKELVEASIDRRSPRSATASHTPRRS